MPDTVTPARMYARTASSSRSIALPFVGALLEPGSAYSLEPGAAADPPAPDMPRKPGRPRGTTGTNTRSLVKIVTGRVDRDLLRAKVRARMRSERPR